VLVAYDRLFGLELEHLAEDGCITKAPCGGQVAGPSPVDRRKQGLKRSVAVEAGGIPLAVLAAPANHRDDGLLAAILDAAATVTTAAVGPMPRTLTVHLDAGYDWKPCRQILTERGMAAEIATRGVPAPIQAGRRWVIERTHAWANQYGKLRWCTERHRLVVEFWLALALAVLVCGRRLVVRNGHARQRQVMTAAGAILVRAPRVDDRRTDLVTGQRIRFRSVRLPPWCRKSPKVAEVLPLLYLHGLSTGDFAPALAAFFGSAAGLSAAAIGRLLGAWQADDQAFCQCDLAERDYVDLWADGLHFRVRLEQAHLCCLVLVGVRADGTKELVAVADGERESTESWAELLGDLRRRGMRAPVVAVGDGALGLWAALRDVFPATRQQRDWVHKLANVLNALPNSVHAGARKALARSGMHPTATTPSSCSPATTASSGPRRWPRSPTTPRRCSRSTISRPSIGCT
jgi:hypothetical protein